MAGLIFSFIFPSFIPPQVQFSMGQSRGGHSPTLFSFLLILALLVLSMLIHEQVNMANLHAQFHADAVKIHNETDRIRDVLIGFAANYGAEQIYPILHAFHEMTGPHQYIALFVTLPKHVKVQLRL